MQPDSLNNHKKPLLKLVLITNGLRPVLDWFTDLPVTRVGVIEWQGDSQGSLIDRLTRHPAAAGVYAKVRARRFATLRHYCQQNELLYARISKNHPLKLQQLLKLWAPDLVLSSGCPFIPMSALADTPLGGINLHPSALPAYRGADPLIWQVLDQVVHVGASVHRLTDQYDMGSILARKQIARVAGISRSTLIHQLEGQLGRELTHEAIEKLEKTASPVSWDQSAISPTPTAKRLNVNSVGEIRPLEQCSPLLAWDIVRFYGVCPPAWLDQNGWQPFMAWKPVNIRYANQHTLRQSTPWRIVKTGLWINLVCDSATITLRPAVKC